MGKSMTNCATQAKERARQQKQLDKASKRMFARQQRVYAKTSAPNKDSDIIVPISATRVVGSTD